MAGVGFELKKLFRNEKGYSQSVKAYTVSAIVTEGPMLLNILLLFLMRSMMKHEGASIRQLDIFLYTITYITIFSLILSNAVLMFIDRYVSDCIYKKEIQYILPTFFSIMFWLCLIGGVIAWIYLMLLPVDFFYRIVSLTGFCTMLIIWTEVSFLSAVKQYTKVFLGFAAGFVVAIVAGMLLLHFTDMSRVMSALCATILGYFLMLLMFFQQLLAYFPKGRFNLFQFFPALDEYKILILVGFFMALGLFLHNFILWGSEFKNEIWRYGVYCTKYDIPVFLATLTITPMLVRFVVSVETNFYRQYREYFDTILYGGILEDIQTARKNVAATMFRELEQMMEIQFFITVICATFLGNYLNKVILDEQQTGIFRILCFGYCMYGLMKCMIIMMLYFEDRAGALIGAFQFVACSGVFTWLFMHLDPVYWGFGFLLAAFLTVIYGAFRLRFYLKRLEYKVFLKQPLFLSEEKGIFANFAETAQMQEERFKRNREMRRTQGRRGRRKNEKK